MKSGILLAILACTATAVIAGSIQGTADKKVICYFTNWANYRTGDASYKPSDIDGTLCTHILYSFAALNNETLTIEVFDPWVDIDQGYYAQVTAFKSQGVKVLIAIGGWTESADDKYSRMVNDPEARANFVSHVVEFIIEHNFDGLDLDWEYPKCWQGNCDAGPETDKENFVNLVRELRTAFEPHGFLLSSAVAASRATSDQAYDVPALSSLLDWVGLMTYDYHGGWDGVTGHNSPFAGPPPSTIDTVQYWLSNGATPDKLVIGIAPYGRSFNLSNIEENGPGAPATTGTPGEYTGEAGFLAYYEICTGWEYRNVQNVGPYAFRGQDWASFDDEAIIREKAAYVNTVGLAGAMVWTLDLDDFNGKFCGKGAYPLIKALRGAL
jgi:chitinase